MLVATEALRPPKLRIGRLGNSITLPRTVPAAALLSGGVSGLLFIAIFTLIVGWSIASIVYSGVVGVVVGVALVSYSPLRGESLLRWLGLKIKSSRNRSRYMEGVPVRLAVGICYIPTPSQGAVRLRARAIQVRSSLFDERGTRHREARQVLPAWYVDQVRSTNPSNVQHQPSTVYTPGTRLDAYRTAAAKSSIPENYVPPNSRTARRFGRWEQDREALQSMYANDAISPSVPVDGLVSPEDVVPGQP